MSTREEVAGSPAATARRRHLSSNEHEGQHANAPITVNIPPPPPQRRLLLLATNHEAVVENRAEALTRKGHHVAVGAEEPNVPSPPANRGGHAGISDAAAVDEPPRPQQVKKRLRPLVQVGRHVRLISQQGNMNGKQLDNNDERVAPGLIMRSLRVPSPIEAGFEMTETPTTVEVMGGCNMARVPAMAAAQAPRTAASSVWTRASSAKAAQEPSDAH